ncbi:MAG TPA: DMT family transporter [Hydrogenophaga sp.]|jgi:drug/metabolite transporter (DMT)-like permease|uniref:DMT family transporter n=1 Tax=Hydrogenophaga sp. TaxID=1904254 RepID=UPI002B7E1157|nr:DMT family transporter [Hydrogenophaga sp.]HSX94966.1 DMT family transporter [Hydrogenophaga sp.]
MQALWMLLASFFFASMGVCIKFAAAHFNSFETVFYRGVVGLLFLWGLTRWQGVSLATRVPMMHAWRSLVGTISLTAWFYAIALLPLATAMTLNYMSSVWIATFLLGGAVLTQARGTPVREQAPLFMTVIVGFLGVALLLRPSFTQEQAFAGVVGLLSGVFAALAYLQVAALAKVGEPESRTVFYFSLGSALAGLIGMLFVGVSPLRWPGALWLLPIGLLAVGGQLCLTRAYARGATMVVANLHYSGIVFAALFGLTVFGDRIPLIGWIGMGLIIVSGIAATVLRSRTVPQVPAEEP